MRQHDIYFMKSKTSKTKRASWEHRQMPQLHVKEGKPVANWGGGNGVSEEAGMGVGGDLWLGGVTGSPMFRFKSRVDG